MTLFILVCLLIVVIALYFVAEYLLNEEGEDDV